MSKILPNTVYKNLVLQTEMSSLMHLTWVYDKWFMSYGKGLWQSCLCMSILQSSATVICESFARLVGRLTVSQLSLACDQPFHESLCIHLEVMSHFVTGSSDCPTHFSANWHENKHTPSQTSTWPPRQISVSKGEKLQLPKGCGQSDLWSLLILNK